MLGVDGTAIVELDLTDAQLVGTVGRRSGRSRLFLISIFSNVVLIVVVGVVFFSFDKNKLSDRVAHAQVEYARVREQVRTHALHEVDVAERELVDDKMRECGLAISLTVTRATAAAVVVVVSVASVDALVVKVHIRVVDDEIEAVVGNATKRTEERAEALYVGHDELTVEAETGEVQRCVHVEQHLRRARPQLDFVEELIAHALEVQLRVGGEVVAVQKDGRRLQNGAGDSAGGARRRRCKHTVAVGLHAIGLSAHA